MDGRGARSMHRRDVLQLGLGLCASSLLAPFACGTRGRIAVDPYERTTPSMRIVVTSAGGANGNGQGTLLAFEYALREPRSSA
jgi:hypothetical protein